MTSIEGLAFFNFSDAVWSLERLRLTNMILNFYLANYYAIEQPIPSDPPVTSTHPPPYLLYRSALRLRKGLRKATNILTNLIKPTMKQSMVRQLHQHPYSPYSEISIYFYLVIIRVTSKQVIKYGLSATNLLLFQSLIRQKFIFDFIV